jgi:hypothetical protein
MAIHYDPNIERFRDDAGHFVSHDRGMKSSIGREEYYEYQEIQESRETGNYQILDIYDPELEGLDHYPFDLDMDGDLWDEYLDMDVIEYDFDEDVYKGDGD